MGCGPSVLNVLSIAGWTAGREIATEHWTRQLTAAGYKLNDAAVGIWTEWQLTDWVQRGGFAVQGKTVGEAECRWGRGAVSASRDNHLATLTAPIGGTCVHAP